ncbi:YehR family lipoprotein, partial [Citrobacter sp. wls757]
ALQPQRFFFATQVLPLILTPAPFSDCFVVNIRFILYCSGIKVVRAHQIRGRYYLTSDIHEMEFYMKALQKLFSLAMASIVVFSLAGCGDKEETKTFNANINGSDITVSYTYKGDKVLKQISESKISYASVGASNKEEAAKVFDALSAKYQNIPGIEEKLTYSDTYAQENVTIDMEKVDIKALQAISGMKLSENADKNISMKQMQTVMESAGFKEVK